MGHSLSRCTMNCQVCGETVARGAALCVCDGVFCENCVKQWFQTIYDSGFVGSCPPMRCPGCQLIVPMQVWEKVMGPELAATFAERAGKLLTLQCGSCHTPRSLMVACPAAEEGYNAAVNNARQHFVSDKEFQNLLIKDMPRFERGEDTHATERFLEMVVSRLRDFENQAEKQHIFYSVLALIRDPERRANLQLRYLRSYPRIMTPCCNSEHCARCQKFRFHEAQTCEQYQAARAQDDVVTCPTCNLYLVKGDGCDSVNCICGRNFYWSSRVNEMKRLVMDAFVAKFGNVDAAAVEAVRILLDSIHFPHEDVRGAAHLRELDAGAFNRGQAALWPLVQPNRSNVCWAVALQALAHLIPEEHRPLLAAWHNHNGETVERYRLQQRQLRGSVFRDLFPDDPHLAALQIVEGLRPNLAYSPEVSSYAAAHWASMHEPEKIQARQRYANMRADEWRRRFPSVTAAAKAAWQQDQWQQFELVELHPLTEQIKCFMRDARFGYQQMLDDGSLNYSATQLWAEGWGRYLATTSHERAVSRAHELVGNRVTAAPSMLQNRPVLSADPMQALSGSVHALLLEQIRAFTFPHQEPRRQLPAELIAVVENWLKLQHGPVSADEPATPDEVLKVGVSLAC